LAKRLYSYYGEILDVPLIFVKVIEWGDEENQRRYFAAPVSADPRLAPWDLIMLITVVSTIHMPTRTESSSGSKSQA
jgi:hypothetical protein